MTTGAGSAAARLARSPAWQAVAGALVLALAFPSRLPGSLGLLTLAGAPGIGVAWLWPRLPARVTAPDATSAAMFTLALVAAGGIATFWYPLHEPRLPGSRGVMSAYVRDDGDSLSAQPAAPATAAAAR